jgi:hypothetical protein
MSYTFQFPDPSVLPEATGSSNVLWLEILVNKIDTNTQISNPNANIPTSPAGYSYKLMMPDNFSLSLSHNWEPYEQMASRLADTLTKYYRTAQQVAGIWNSGLPSTFAGAFLGSGGYKNLIDVLATKTGMAEPVVNTRTDSPLVYKTTQPLQYNINFSFVATRSGEPGRLFQMVQELLMFSSPSRPTSSAGGTQISNIKIDPPYIFEVKTLPSTALSSTGGALNVLNLKYAALTTINPTFYGPYIDGCGTKLDLTLTFTDITPLFSNTFAGGGTSVTAAPTSVPSSPTGM